MAAESVEAAEEDWCMVLIPSSTIRGADDKFFIVLKNMTEELASSL